MMDGSEESGDENGFYIASRFSRGKIDIFDLIPYSMRNVHLLRTFRYFQIVMNELAYCIWGKLKKKEFKKSNNIIQLHQPIFRTIIPDPTRWKQFFSTTIQRFFFMFGGANNGHEFFFWKKCSSPQQDASNLDWLNWYIYRLISTW